MFIRSITVKGKKYYRLVESYRENGKVKQRYIASLFNGEQVKYNDPEDFAEMVADFLRNSPGLVDNLEGNKKSISQQIMYKARELLCTVR